MISVLVADDHPVVRDGLCTMLELEADIKVVGRAADGAEAVEQARRTHPDVILMDVQMPVMDGIEALRKIRARDPEARVIVLTTYRNEDYIFPVAEGRRGRLPAQGRHSRGARRERSARSRRENHCSTRRW